MKDPAMEEENEIETLKKERKGIFADLVRTYCLVPLFVNSVVVAAPGIGKGTLIGAIRDAVPVHHIESSTELELHGGEELATMQQYRARGELVPDDLMLPVIGRILEHRVFRPRAEGVQGFYVKDGLPRTGIQARQVLEALEVRGYGLDLTAYLPSPEPAVAVLGQVTRGVWDLVFKGSARKDADAEKALGRYHDFEKTRPDILDILRQRTGKYVEVPRDTPTVVAYRLLENAFPKPKAYRNGEIEPALGKLRALDETLRVLTFLHGVHTTGNYETQRNEIQHLQKQAREVNARIENHRYRLPTDDPILVY